MNSNSNEKEDIEGRYGSLHTASSSPSSYTSPSDHSPHPVAVATKENTILTKKFGTNILPPDMIRTRTVLAASITFAVVVAVTICYLYSSRSSSSNTLSSMQLLRTVHKDDTCVPPSNIPFDVYGGDTGEFWDSDARQERRVRSAPFE